MQERQFAGEAEQRTSSWYLSRGNQQWGPLGDRELLLLAERGGLREDDLLWKPGFESWKPVRSVCDLGATSNSARAQQEATQDADDLTSDVSEATIAEPAASEMQAPKPSLKTRLYDELRKFLAIFAYLWLVFSVFLLHEWAVLAGHQISFKFYSLAVVNALILAKIMLIAEAFGFANRLDDKPLIYPIAFKSIAFSALLMLSYIAEETAVGLFHGKSAAESVPQIGGGGLVGMLIIGVIMCIALVPFFAFREIARTVGAAEFRALMLGSAKTEQDDQLPIEAAAEAA
jgi:GYF domain 2